MDLDKEKLTFEEALQEVEQLVRSLESNSLPLADVLTAFERGILLTRFCQEYLSGAEQRIEQIVQTASGRLELKPFEGELK